MYRKIIGILLSVILLFVSVSAFGDQKQTIYYAAAADSPPFSFEVEGQAQGFLKEMVDLINEYSDLYEIEFKLLPWPRAQRQVELGNFHVFCTYPSSDRQEYALFSEEPVLNVDYGTLVFNRDNPNKERIQQARSWDDLKGLIFVGTYDSGWEDENIPASFERFQQPTHLQSVQALLRRGVGDFMVVDPIEAAYYAREAGLVEKMDFVSVDFINDSLIPFNFGVSKALNNTEEMMNHFNSIFSTPEYKQKMLEIVSRYTS